MKKAILIILCTFLLTGCMNIENSSYEKIVSETTLAKTKIYNNYRKGYKFYLPRGLYIKDSNSYNEVIEGKDETFYLYIDLISYLNKNTESHSNEGDIYYKELPYGDMVGYLQIKNASNGKYLVEIAYNCAKIEVIVEKSRVKECTTEALIILSSIKYNDSFLENSSTDSLLNYKEEIVDIFNKVNKENKDNILEWKEDYDGTESDVPDWDHINEGT